MDGIGRAKMAAGLCIVLVGLCGVGQAGVIYVDDDASSGGTGTSWASAYRYLQDALAVTKQGDEVHVAQGVYRPNEGAGATALPPSASAASGTAEATPPGPQFFAFFLRNSVAIIGGYAGVGAEDPNARDVEQYRTILSGDLAGNDDDSLQPWHPIYQFRRLDNSAAVVRSELTDATATLDGFIIEGGDGTGMHNEGGSPVVTNCTFRRNSTGWFSGSLPPSSAITAYWGGGFRSVVVLLNSRERVGGHPKLSHCMFEGNAAQRRAGAIYFEGAGLTLSDCRFVGNWTLGDGGAVYAGGDVEMTDCVFESNAAASQAGAADVAGDVELIRCRFHGNIAVEGGAVLHGGSHVLMDGCSFVGNSATSHGGALYGTSAYTEVGAAVVTNCLFTGNRTGDVAGAGGAVYGSSTPYGSAQYAMSNCTFAGNWAPSGSSVSWPSFSPGSSIVNCILWDNDGGIYNGPPDARRTSFPAQFPNITYSDVRGGWTGAGNIDADPCFASPGYWADGGDTSVVVEPNHPDAVWVDGDYHLKSQWGRWDPVNESWILDDVTSPCIDAGDPGSPIGDELQPNGGRVNMGAYGGAAQASKSQPSTK